LCFWGEKHFFEARERGGTKDTAAGPSVGKAEPISDEQRRLGKEDVAHAANEPRWGRRAAVKVGRG